MKVDYIIVDSDFICHQNKHSMKKLSWEDKHTGVIFGFLRDTLTLAKKLDCNRFIFVWDSSESKRKRMFPDYKANRAIKKKTVEEEELSKVAHPQFDIIRTEILPALGFKNNFIQDGLEGDDLIAKLVLEYDWTNFAVVTIDSDLYQMLRTNAFIYNPRKKKRYTIANFKEQYGIDPWQWSTVLSIAGCTTDNVPGINGVGKPTAIKYLKGELPPSRKVVQKILSKEGKDIRKRNDWLVRLPFHDTKPMTVRSKQSLYKDEFVKVCRKYGFESFLRKDKYKEWKEVMEFE